MTSLRYLLPLVTRTSRSHGSFIAKGLPCDGPLDRIRQKTSRAPAQLLSLACSLLLSVVATDRSLGAKLARQRTGKGWSTLTRVSFSRLERALVSGTTRTLWLSGIHRSVATKPDSKVLIGRDVEASP